MESPGKFPVIPHGVKTVTYQPNKGKTEEISVGHEGIHTVKEGFTESKDISLNRLSKSGNLGQEPIVTKDNHNVEVLNLKKTTTDSRLRFKAKLKEVGPKIKKFAIMYLKALNPLHLITDPKAFQSLKDKIRSKFQSKSTKTESKKTEPKSQDVKTEEVKIGPKSQDVKTEEIKTEPKSQEIQGMSFIQIKKIKKWIEQYKQDLQFSRDPQQSPTFTETDVANSIFQFAKEKNLTREECKAIFDQVFNQPSDIKFDNAEKVYQEVKERVSSEKRTVEMFQKRLNSKGEIPTKIIEYRPVQQTAIKSEIAVKNSQILEVFTQPTKESSSSSIEKTEKKVDVKFSMLEKDDKGDFKNVSPKKLMEFLIQYDLADNKENIDPSFHKLHEMVSSQFKRLTDPKAFLKDYIQGRLDLLQDKSSKNLEAVLNDAVNLAAKGGMKKEDVGSVLMGEFKEVFGGVFKGRGESEEFKLFNQKLNLLQSPPSKTLLESNDPVKLNSKNFLGENKNAIVKDIDKSMGILLLNLYNPGDSLEGDQKKVKESQRQLVDFTNKVDHALSLNILGQSSLEESLKAIDDTIELAYLFKESGNLHMLSTIGGVLNKGVVGSVLGRAPENSERTKKLEELKEILSPKGNSANLRKLIGESIIPPLSLTMGNLVFLAENPMVTPEKDINFTPVKISNNIDSEFKKSNQSLVEKYTDLQQDSVVLETNLQSYLDELPKTPSERELSQMKKENQEGKKVDVKKIIELENKMKTERDKELNILADKNELNYLIEASTSDQKFYLDKGLLKIKDRESGLFNFGVGTSEQSVEGAGKLFNKLNIFKGRSDGSSELKKELLRDLGKLEAQSLSKEKTWLSRVIKENPEIKKQYEVLMQWKNEENEKELSFFLNLVVNLTENKKLFLNENGSLSVVGRKSKEGSEENVGKSNKSRDAALAFLNKLDDVSKGREKECVRILNSLGKNIWFQKVIQNHKGVGEVFEQFKKSYENRQGL